MLKISLFLCGLLALAPQAAAEEDFFNLEEEPAASVAVATDKKPEPDFKAEKTKEPAEDKGIFSFLNFSFGKKKPEVKVDASPEETVLQKLTRMAGEGDINSQLSLGYMYLYGEDGVSVDYKKAFDYYKMAADQNDNVAVNNLGSLYFSGIGTEADPAKAMEMFKKASDLGNNEATLNLAFLYLSGQGGEKDHRKAIQLLAKAADAGNPTAEFMIGYAYYKGYLVEKNYLKAFNYIVDSANAGYDEALNVLSELYINGLGTPKNYGNAVRALNKAVAQGNVDAMVSLGSILAIGEKYPQDIYTAHIMFNLAAVRGAEDAAEKRDTLESKLPIENLLQAQAAAEQFVEKPSELTIYIHKTFGPNIKSYIDAGLKRKN